MLRRFHHTALTLMTAALVIAGCGPAPDRDTGISLTLLTSDGYELPATFQPVEADAPAGAVLVHMLGSDRHAWEPFARALQRAGIATIVFDLRGHGESRHAQRGKVSRESFTPADWAAAQLDIDAAVTALRARGVDSTRIAIIGASIGANLALNYAAEHPEVAALVLLSPGLEYRGVRTQSAMGRFTPRPVLLMASENDAYAAQSCTTLASEADEAFVELRLFPGASHGTDLLAGSRAAAPQIVQWLELTLALEPAP